MGEGGDRGQGTGVVNKLPKSGRVKKAVVFGTFVHVQIAGRAGCIFGLLVARFWNKCIDARGRANIWRERGIFWFQARRIGVLCRRKSECPLFSI
jgi:hypothetical protein